VKLANADHAIEVMAGAVLPDGTDWVIPQEEYELSAGAVALKSNAAGSAYRDVQRRGEDSQPGVAMLKAGVRAGSAASRKENTISCRRF
jgi:molybdopterin biosynthesis enzyme